MRPGIARPALDALELDARRLAMRLLLETGTRQPEAIALTNVLQTEPLGVVFCALNTFMEKML